MLCISPAHHYLPLHLMKCNLISSNIVFKILGRSGQSRFSVVHAHFLSGLVNPSSFPYHKWLLLGWGPDLHSGLWGSSKGWNTGLVGEEMKTNSDAFLSLKLCHILYKYSGSIWCLFFCCIWSKEKRGQRETQGSSCHCRNGFNASLQKRQYPAFISPLIALSWLTTDCWVHWPSVSPGYYQPLIRPAPCSIHSFSPHLVFLHFSLYLNFSFLSAIILRQCLYLSVKQYQETFVGLDLSCLVLSPRQHRFCFWCWMKRSGSPLGSSGVRISQRSFTIDISYITHHIFEHKPGQ